MRNAVLKLHLWVGITAAVLLFLTGVSGALLVFENEIDAALNPRMNRVTPQGEALSLTAAKAALEKAFPGYRAVSFDMPQKAEQSAGAYMAPQNGRGFAVAYNQYTGEVLGKVDNGRFTRKLHTFHTQFLAGPPGSDVVGWIAAILFFLALSGIYLWWPRKHVGVLWGSTGTKFHFDLHNTVGILSSLVLLIFAGTGIVLHWEQEAGRLATQMTGAPFRPDVPKINAPQGSLPMSPDQLLTIGRHEAPGAVATRVDLPDDEGDAALVVLKYPEDRTPAGRTRIFINPYAGNVVAKTDSRTTPTAMTFVGRVNRELHTGDVYGWPTRLLAFLFSLMLPVLAVTGPMLWWYRRKAAQRVTGKPTVVAA